MKGHPNFKTLYKSICNNDTGYWQKNRHTGVYQGTRIYEQVIFDKSIKVTQWRRESFSFFIQVVLEQIIWRKTTLTFMSRQVQKLT